METLQRTANRGSISTGYEIDNSVKLEDDNTEYLQRPASGSDGSRRTMTISMWLKRTEIDDDQIFISQGSNIRFRFKPNYFHIRLTNGSSTYEIEDQNRLFRDTSAWYHLVVAIDTTQSTASNRVKIYWNGVQHTSFTTANYPSQNDDLTLGNFSATTMQLGWFTEGGYGFNGYFAEVHYVDGTQVAQTEFGEFDDDSGIWKPKEYTGGHGSEGFYLKFENSSNLGADSSGNGNNFTLNNISAADQATDTPTNNFCTLNLLHNYFNETSKFVITEGGTKVTGSSASTAWRGVPSTFAVSSGKWYFELSGSGSYILIGAGSADTGQTEWAELTSIASPSTKAKMMYSYNGGIYGYNSSTDAWQYGFGFGHGTAYNVGVAVDLDNGHMYFSKDGAAYTDSGDPTSGSTGTGAIDLPWYNTESTVFIVTVANSGSTSLLNFGGYTTGTISSAASDANGYGTFEYAPPSGYYAICTKNLAEYG